MKKKFKLGCLTIILLTALAAGTFLYRQYHYVDSVIAKAREANLPISYEELDAQYPNVPDDQNAALVYQRAAAMIDIKRNTLPREVNDRYDVLPIVGTADKLPGEGWTEEELGLANEYLADHADILAEIYAADAMAGFAAYDDFSAGPSIKIPHLASMRACARMLAFEARAAAMDGRNADAVRALQAAARLVQRLNTEPLLIGQLVRSATWGIAVVNAQAVVMGGTLTDAELAAVDAAFAPIEDFRSTSAGLVGEFVMALSSRNMGTAAFGISGAEGPMAQEFPRLYRAGNAIVGQFTQGLFAGVAESQIGLIKATAAPFPEALDNVEDAQAGINETMSTNPVAAIMMPSFNSIATAEARPLAQNRVLRATIAIERYRLANGKAPYTLDALVPQYLDAVIEDPFDGKPLRYLPSKNLSEGYSLYSIGSDRTDDNGELDPKFRSGDIGFVIAP